MYPFLQTALKKVFNHGAKQDKKKTRGIAKKRKLTKAFSKLSIENVEKLAKSSGGAQTKTMGWLPEDDEDKISCCSGDTTIVEKEDNKLEERKAKENGDSDIPPLKRTHRIYGSLPSEWM